MLKKMSLRSRLTVLSITLLTICCICLTAILNFSANQMANVIEAIPVIPANEIGADGKIKENSSYSIGMVPMSPSMGSQTARRLFFYQSIVSMVLVVAVGGMLTYYIAGRALRPLYVLSGQMKNRTVHNLSESLPIPMSHDEISDLTISFNEMSANLDEVFATQKRFSQSAAHELRTPLTVLKTKVDVFKKKKEHSPEEYENLLTIITTHTNRLSDLVKNLLDLTNMDALECSQQINLKIMLTEVAEELATLAEGKNIRITILGDEQVTKGNQNLLHRAFYNLIENAIKYNHEDGRVEIVLSTDSNHTAVTIKDSGIGIPEKMHKLIFEPFFRIDKSRSRQIGGAGLGLSMVKSIVDKHHGKITVSTNSDNGMVFKIIL